MDSIIAAAARALSLGNALGALDLVALRDDAHALALRGTAMGQLQQYDRARFLLKKAAQAFGPLEELARARCALAEAEIAILMRDLKGAAGMFTRVSPVLERHHDATNLLHARLVEARRLLLLGRVRVADDLLRNVELGRGPPLLVAFAELTKAELALRLWRAATARVCLDRAEAAALASGNAMLLAEVTAASAALGHPAAQLITQGDAAPVRLQDVEALLSSGILVVDGCRRGITKAGAWIPLARRPILFGLAHSLASAWPADVDRESLIARAFRTRRPDETHRARLRVEMGRLRALIKEMAKIVATPRGFSLRSLGDIDVAVLEPPIKGPLGALRALLSDGSRWSTAGLAEALGASQRTVQRALAELEDVGQAQSVGTARARRWQAPPLTDLTTILLLPTSLAGP